MVSGQSKHIVPVAKTDKLLMGNGAEKALPHMIGSDFINIAKQDGKVVEIDNATGMMIVEYADGSHDTCDLSSKVVKNGGGGFYVANTKVTNLKVGDKFRKGDTLAKNPEFFKGDVRNTEYAVGNLTKIAIHSGYYTFEDATIATDKFCKEMTSYITMRKELVLSPATNIDKMVKVGDSIKTGDPLIIFEEVFGDADMAALLDKMGQDLSDGIAKDSKNYLKSKYTGTIEDIKIYCTVPEDELSPSLRKVVKEYNAKMDAKKAIIDKYYKDGEVSNVIIPPSSQVEAVNGKVKGVEVGEGVLIEFFIKYADELGVGDKVSYYTALKGIISEKIPDELAPYSDFRPDEQVSAILATIGVNARMTASVFLALFGNKVLIELKRKCKELYK